MASSKKLRIIFETKSLLVISINLFKNLNPVYLLSFFTRSGWIWISLSR